MKKEPHFIRREAFFANKQYKQWFGSIKQRFQQSQIKAAIRVNTALLEFYWSLGYDIVNLKAEKTWGSGIVEQLSLDLKDAFPNIKGFSTSNIWYAKKWYLFYSDLLIKSNQINKGSVQQPENNEDLKYLQQVVGELPMPDKFGLVPWGHHIVIITKCKTTKEALFYIDRTIEGNWSRSRLIDEITGDLFGRQGTAITNFSDSLPVMQGQLAIEMLKDPYKLDFLGMTAGYTEKQLEDALSHNITRFLLELGKGFAYIGRQMELRMPGGQTFFPDMIFYHIKLKCYVVIELKVVPFIPEFAGKLNFYVTAADKLLKDENDNPSIGLLICRSKDETIVKWSFQDISKPIGVAAYELQEIFNKTLSETLPSIEEIERIIEE